MAKNAIRIKNSQTRVLRSLKKLKIKEDALDLDEKITRYLEHLAGADNSFTENCRNLYFQKPAVNKIKN